MSEYGFEMYMAGQEAVAAGVEVDKVAAILRAEVNKNRDCFIYSFGWKDADLDSEGCTGIKSIYPIDDESIAVVIGGHKTVCPPEDESKMDIAHDLVSDACYPGEWTGDDWMLYTEETIESPWVFTADGGDIDYQATADEIVRRAKEAIAPFSAEMAAVHEAMETLE